MKENLNRYNSYYHSNSSVGDYYPFGMVMPERDYNGVSYRYGYNGQEQDDEIAGIGNINTAEYWEYDCRLGRRWNLDPIINENESRYCCFGNNPILFIDIKGNKFVNPFKKEREKKQAAKALAQINYDNLVERHVGELTSKDKKKYSKISNLKQAKVDLENVENKFNKVELFLSTFNAINPAEYNYFETLQDGLGNEIKIIINLPGYNSGNKSGQTFINPFPISVQNYNTGVSKTVYGVVDNEIKVELYVIGEETQTLANELGDIKYYFTKVFDDESFNLWRSTAGNSGSGQSESSYRDNKKGAGYYSFQYEEQFKNDFKTYIKINKIPMVNYDLIHFTLILPKPKPDNEKPTH